MQNYIGTGARRPRAQCGSVAHVAPSHGMGSGATPDGPPVWSGGPDDDMPFQGIWTARGSHAYGAWRAILWEVYASVPMTLTVCDDSRHVFTEARWCI